MKLIIEIDEARFKDVQRIAEVQLEMSHFQTAEQIIAKGIPLEQEPKTGYWEWVQYDANPEIGNFHCSECRYIPASFNMSAQKLNYCPKCGAKMESTILKESEEV